MRTPIRIGLIADFNATNLVGTIVRSFAPLDATVNVAPFGQVMPTLLQRSGEFWDQSYDLIVVWTFPGSVVPGFNDVLELREWSVEAVTREVDLFADAVSGLKDHAAHVFVASWVPASFDGQRPTMEMTTGGTTTMAMRMNLRLAEKLAAVPGAVLFNVERWIRAGGANAFSDKLWYLAKTPYSRPVFEEAARDCAATFQSLRGGRRKVVILDLDNTLWGGVVGDVGWESIQLGGHDAVGEAYAEFQRALKRLSREGIVLAIVSKNEEAVALEAIDSSAEMVLRSTDFVGWRINWRDKAQNVADLMEELNLGLSAAVFIDDSPHERSRVREALPEVLVPEWPADPMEYAKALRGLRCFESVHVSQEDRDRTTMYVADRGRKALKAEVASVDQWLEMLDLEVHVEALSAGTLDRTVQLLNKTNQMNLATRRLSASELQAWASSEGRQVWTFRVKDKFGDYGLCGVASLAFDDERAHLVDFLLSCRAMGRGVEDAMMSVAASKAQEGGAVELNATYVPTTKNKPCIRWIEEQSPLTRGNDGTFVLQVASGVSTPRHISIKQCPR